MSAWVVQCVGFGKELCANHVEVFICWENFRFCVEVWNWCCLGATCYSSESFVLCLLNLL